MLLKLLISDSNYHNVDVRVAAKVLYHSSVPQLAKQADNPATGAIIVVVALFHW